MELGSVTSPRACCHISLVVFVFGRSLHAQFEPSLIPVAF